MTRVLGASPTGVCPQCGVTFSRIDKDGRLLPHKMYCGIQCQRVAIRERNRQKRPVYICQHCGKPFQPKANDRTKYCSRECYFAQKRELAAKGQSCPITYCQVCGKAVMGHRKACPGECATRYRHSYSIAYERANHDTRACVCSVCGKSFAPEYGDKSRVFCSEPCRRIAKNTARRGVGRNHRDRARRYGGRYEYVKLSLIFERDGWRCRQCGRKTPQRLRGTLKPNAPELDHIIPLSVGGAHTEHNLQCLCRSCNIAKGATGHGQLVLV